MTSIHKVSNSFNLDKFLKARELTKEAIKEISRTVKVGMNEDDGQEIINRTLKDMGAQKNWHPSKFRIGENTTKSFRDISSKNIVLNHNDLFFIDIGPIWDGHEGDYGETFSCGQSTEYQNIIRASKDIFLKTQKIWKEENLSGINLYDFAANCAEEQGYQLNNRMKGHRLGDFPHHLFYKGGMNETQETPQNNLWVLEIHIMNKAKSFGAFFEDILQK